MSLCPERELRDSMTEDEFWAHVYRDYLGVHELAEELEDIETPTLVGSPCPECGAAGACGYDTEGRALIHALSEED
jgi:hypothetical protein